MISGKYLSVIGLFFLHSISAQSFLNLDLEETNLKNLPLKWMTLNGGYTYQSDKDIKFSRNRSIKITRTSSNSTEYASVHTQVPIHLFRGKTLHLTAKVKIQSQQNGNAGLWIKVNDEKNAIISFDNMENQRIEGTTDWKEISLTMKISPQAERIMLGGIFQGQGIAWFDDFKLTSDQQPIGDASKKDKLSQEEITLLKKYIYPLKTFDPEYSNNQDLEILKKLTGNSKVIALGESTHGSAEIFKMKDRIIRFLIQNNNFNIFSIEARMPESYRISDYIIKGEGSAKDCLRGMNFWTWKTNEVLNMIEWMKKYNQSADKKVSFTGFDMQNFSTPITELKKEFKDSPSIIRKLDDLEILLINFKDKKLKKTASVMDSKDKETAQSILSSIKKEISTTPLSSNDPEWTRQYIRLLEQNTELNTLTRDQFMAENVLWIKNHNPDSKIILWAHNGHINKAPIRMGKYLSDELGKDYVSIGFAFYSGQYTAKGENGLTAYDAQEPYVGTYEYYLNSINEPYFILDIKKMKEDNNERLNWLIKDLDLRRTGAANIPDEFTHKNISEDFDYLIFINQSTASVLFN